jgi:hypothetical protein
MHVIRDKKSGKVIYIDHSPSAELKPGEKVYPEFKVKTMEVGWTDKAYVPAYFDIDKQDRIVEMTPEQAVKAGLMELAPDQKLVKGEVVGKSDDELVNDGLLSLDDLKEQAIVGLSDYSFTKRQELLPDYRLQNAMLGVYDEKTVANCRATVQAFRDEFYRVKELIEKAKTVKALKAIEPNFPKKIVSAKKAGGSK